MKRIALYQSQQRRFQHGASLVEFTIIGGTLVLVGLFTLQLGLIYHAKTTLNYATFEAARVGAVSNASVNKIEAELGRRLAPLQGGDGTVMAATTAVLWSSVNQFDPLNTEVEFLNPTPEAFADWAVNDPDTGKRFIPANHLRHQSYDIGSRSGLSLRDANILKIRVTHGVKLRVPVIGRLVSMTMRVLDGENIVYYLRDMWPLQSVATVRMQSDSYEDEVLSSFGGSDDDSLGSAGTSTSGNDVAGSDQNAGTSMEGNDDQLVALDTQPSDVIVPIDEPTQAVTPVDEPTAEMASVDVHTECAEGFFATRVPSSDELIRTGASGDLQGLMKTSRFREMMALGYY